MTPKSAYRHGLWQLASLPVMLAVVGIALGPAGGSATARAPRRLSRADRSAITLRSLHAVGDASTGVVLTATFRGNVSRALRRAPLHRAALALILTPAGSGRAPGGLIDLGGGDAAARIPLLIRRSGHGTALLSDVVDLSKPDRVQRTAQASQVQVLRNGARVIFAIPSAALRGVSRITVEALVTNPVGSHPLTTSRWRSVLRRRPFSRSSLAVPAPITCPQLRAMIAHRTDVAPVDLEPQLMRARQLRTELETALNDFRRIAPLLAHARGLHGVTRRGLRRALAQTNARIARLRAAVAAEGGAAQRINSLIRGCAAASGAAPAPAPSPPPAPAPSPAPVSVVQTDPSLAQYMAPQPGLGYSPSPPVGASVVDVNDQIRYQQFTGLGGAMTDTAAWLIESNLPPSSGATLMQDLFSTSGIHLNFLRVPMGASDFTVSPNPYSYDDMPAGQTDPTLAHFSIAHDQAYIIPAVRQALAIDPGLQISANPWSPPAWMKANDSLDNPNDTGTLIDADYQPLADYFVKFIQAYAASGVPVDAVVPQNEPAIPPGTGTQYPGLTLPASDEESFIAKDLAPALDSTGLSTKIYGNDLSWDQLSYAQAVASGASGRDLSGIAWHCYVGSPEVMSEFHQTHPNLDQIVDECSPEIRSFGAPEYLISVLRNWASAAAVWNLALDPQGGPKQANNGCPGCSGLVTVNEQSQTFSFTNEYYQLGQVSSFVEPGAVRIDSPNFVTYQTNPSNGFLTVSSGLDDVAFLNPDGSKVLITHNNSSSPISFAVQTDGRYFAYTSPPGAMTTFQWR